MRAVSRVFGLCIAIEQGQPPFEFPVTVVSASGKPLRDAPPPHPGTSDQSPTRAHSWLRSGKGPSGSPAPSPGHGEHRAGPIAAAIATARTCWPEAKSEAAISHRAKVSARASTVWIPPANQQHNPARLASTRPSTARRKVVRAGPFAAAALRLEQEGARHRGESRRPPCPARSSNHLQASPPAPRGLA